MQVIIEFVIFLAALLFVHAALAQDVSKLTVEKIAKGFDYTEGPVWSLEGFLLFSDNVTNRLEKWTPGTGLSDLGERPGGASGNAYDQKGRLYTCEFRARRVTRTDKKGRVEVLAERFEGKRLNAPNDIVVRRDDNVYFTDPAFGNQQNTRELDFYGVYRITRKGDLEAIARWKTRPNGIALSPNERVLYVADSDERSIHEFDLDRGGAASNDRVFVANIDGVPGGIRTDEKGNLYVAAKEVSIFSPEGKLVRRIALGETPSNLAFGDPDFASLFVTAHTSVYRVRVGVKGALPYAAQVP
jgi:gluconolactonase